MDVFDDICGVMDVICPMHVMLNSNGDIIHAGPTLAKLWQGEGYQNTRFLEMFEVLRPKAVTDMPSLLATTGHKLHVRKRTDPKTTLKGVLMPSSVSGGAVVNLSFGISIMDGVRDYALTSTDFAATDLTIEMLYLIEAKSAAMEASRKLNLRLQGAMIAAEEQAFTDTLTGLKNRRAVDFILPRLIEKGTGFALMQMDLDYFKAVNDTHGHAAGDHVLQHVARIMVEETRDEDCVARVGGDEFVLIFDGFTNRGALADLARRLIQRIEVPVPFEAIVCNISSSIGIALSRNFPLLDDAGLMAAADAALYASKRGGRAQFQFASDLENIAASITSSTETLSELSEDISSRHGRSGPLS
ncbi:diguanylate cyclase [Shimia gijangensis]|uniref:guanylate cyclase n=1 Tax=Shimia gijangensis TaxID=1470563 RepID=A0A1M6LJH1_9RHOB|nr:diguanylate cyclase [Shimia gijangensis]SHJ71322.1 diguanylate cyclase [Shimia gijangensis]